MEEFGYSEAPDLYNQAMLALGHREELRKYWEAENGVENFESLTGEVHDDPLELLDPDESARVREMAQSQAILNGDTGSLAGMDYLHTGSASD